MKKESMTLVELVVVVIIVGILSSAAAGSFTQVGARQYKNDIQLILSDISLAREMSVTRHQAYTVNFNTTREMYTVCNANCSCCNANGCLTTCSCCIISSAGYGQKLRTKLDAAPNWIKFSPPFGVVTKSSTAAVTISRSDSAKSPSTDIVVDANTGCIYAQ